MALRLVDLQKRKRKRREERNAVPVVCSYG